MFSLEELNDKNYSELSKLKISEHQKEFVKDFQGCVDYKKRYPFLRIFGIKHDDTFVGLTAFARWDNDESIPIEDRWTWFDEFFFDLKYQHHGYGKQVVPIILKEIQKIYNPKFVVLSVRNDNEPGKILYHEMGFIDTNLVYRYEDDSVFKKDIIEEKDEFVMYRMCD